jgi:uncharacterized protein (DUF779 family)
MGLEFTAAARALLAEMKREHPTSTLVVVIGGGCCENTAPILMKNFRVGRTDRLLGEVFPRGQQRGAPRAATVALTGRR